MNILLFLTPKQEVSLLYEDMTIGQALNAMERMGYNSIPVIRRTGEYVGTITEGDLLWHIRKLKNGFEDALYAPLTQVHRRRDNKPLLASMAIEDLMETSLEQNFAPVVDDRGMFIGIITRKRVIGYLSEQLRLTTFLRRA